VNRFVPEYFQSAFDGSGDAFRFVGGTLSAESLAQFKRSLERLADEFEELARHDARLPLERRNGCSAVLAVRSWEFSEFTRLRRGASVRGSGARMFSDPSDDWIVSPSGGVGGSSKSCEIRNPEWDEGWTSCTDVIDTQQGKTKERRSFDALHTVPGYINVASGPRPKAQRRDADPQSVKPTQTEG
jgi:hypothetical protein